MNNTPKKTAPDHQPYMDKMSKADTPTPRTDAVRKQGGGAGRFVTLAEELECELARVKAERDGWMNAVIDALVVAYIYTKEHDTDPRKAINDLIEWHCQVALDPLVSERAIELRDTYKAEREALIVLLIEAQRECHEDEGLVARIDAAIAVKGDK